MAIDDDFIAVAEAAVDDVLRLRPDIATQQGDHRFDDQLPDLSDSGMTELTRVVRRHRDALDALDTTPLAVEEQVDAAILRSALERILFTTEVSRDHEWDLLAHEAGDPLYLLMSRETAPLEHRVHAIASRLTLLPDFFATTRRTVTRSPRVHAATVLGQLPGLRGVITTELDRTIAGDAALTALVDGPRTAALAALDEHERWLQTLATTTDGDPRLGPELFARKLTLTLDSTLSPDDVAALARQHLDETTRRLYETAREFLASAGRPDDGDRDDVIRSALDLVAQDVPTDDTVVAICEEAMVEATEAVRRLAVVTVPDDPMSIEVM